QAEDGIRDRNVTGVQTCALPILWTAAPVSPDQELIHPAVPLTETTGVDERHPGPVQVERGAGDQGQSVRIAGRELVDFGAHRVERPGPYLPSVQEAHAVPEAPHSLALAESRPEVD